MIQLVNARERLPVYHRTYWAKCDGARKMLYWHEFTHALEYYNEVLWVEEESDVFTPAKTKQYVSFERDVEEPTIPSKATEQVLIGRDLGALNVIGHPTNKPVTPAEVVQVQTIIGPPPPATVPLPELPACKEYRARYRRRYTPPKLQQIAVNVESVPQASLLEREYGTYTGVEICGYENPNCPLAKNDALAHWKFEEREALMFLMSHHTKVQTYWKSLGLFQVRRLYPFINGAEEIPAPYLAEMVWIYGPTGVQVIAKKLKAAYASKIKREQAANTIKK